MEVIRGIIAILLIFYLGLRFWYVFDLKTKSLSARLGYAWGIGIVVISLQLFLYSVFNIPWTFKSILLIYIPLFVYDILNKNLKLKIISFKIRISHLWIFYVVIFLAIFYTFFESMLRPITAWDGWAQWYLSAKAFYLHQGFDPSIYGYTHYDIPPFINVLIAYFSTFIEGFNDRLSLVIYPIFYLSTGLILFSEFKKHLSINFSLLFLFIFLSIPNIVRHAGRFDAGNADLPLAYFLFVAIILLIKYIETFSVKTLILMHIFLATTALIKNEGMTAFLIVQSLCLYNQIKSRKFSHVLYFLIGFLPVILWGAAKMYFNIPGSYLATGHFILDRLPRVLFEMGKELFNITRWNILWLIFLFSIVIIKINKKEKLILSIIILQFIVYIFVYLITPLDFIKQINNSFDRLLIHLTPLVFLFIAITFSKIAKKAT